MEHLVWYLIFLVLAFVLQLVLTKKAKRRIIKCIPAIAVCVLMSLCFLLYVTGGIMSWVWLIIMLLFAAFFVPIALGAILGNFVKKD